MAPHICAVATLTLGAVMLPTGGETPPGIHAAPPEHRAGRADLMQILVRLQARLARARVELRA